MGGQDLGARSGVDRSEVGQRTQDRRWHSINFYLSANLGLLQLQLGRPSRTHLFMLLLCFSLAWAMLVLCFCSLLCYPGQRL